MATVSAAVTTTARPYASGRFSIPKNCPETNTKLEQMKVMNTATGITTHILARQFSRAVERDFNDLATRYYLNLCGDPKIRVSRDRITVTFDLAKEE